MRYQRNWTLEETIIAKQMADDGRTSGAIAERLGRSRNSVISRARRGHFKLKGQNGRQIAAERHSKPKPERKVSAGSYLPRPVKSKPLNVLPENPPPGAKKVDEDEVVPIYTKDFGPRGTCKWIVGDPKGEWGCCGKPTGAEHLPWCSQHLARVIDIQRGRRRL